MNFGGAGLPHTMRQPETARRQKKSGILGLFPCRASGPFPALFYSPMDRVPTGTSATQPILARFRPIGSPILTPPGRRSIPLPGGPTSTAPIPGCPIPISSRPRFRGADSGMPDPRLPDRESNADARSDLIPRSTCAVRSDPPDPPVRRDRRISL